MILSRPVTRKIRGCNVCHSFSIDANGLPIFSRDEVDGLVESRPSADQVRLETEMQSPLFPGR